MDRLTQALLMTNYEAYCLYTNPEVKPTKFHKHLCNAVQEFMETDTGHALDILCLSAPPQHGKSLHISETLPSWFLGRNPNGKVIEVSYGEDFAKRFGRRNRLKIDTYGKDIFGIELDKPNTDLDFELKSGGKMISRGRTSAITGERCDLMVMDDPIKNREEADSETYRESVYEELFSSYLTRISVGGKMVIMMTRWHEDDIMGRILREFENVTYINYPLEAEEDDVLGRNVGDALCPEIGKDNAWLADYKKMFTSKSGSRAWNALFQGHPTGLEGNLFKREWWNFYKEAPEIVDWVMSVDAAFKDGDDNDFVAIQVWGKNGPDMYLIDAVKKHLNLPGTIREIVRLRSMYGNCKCTLIEDKANGSAIINILRKEMTGIIAVNPLGGKQSRAEAIVGAVESRNVYLPEGKPFVGDFIEECASFPNGAHDDQVDAMTMALNKLIYRTSSIKKARKRTPFEECFNLGNKKYKGDKGSALKVI